MTEISITPVPLDRPPFPLPNVPVPIYFTIQPGVSYIKVANSAGPKMVSHLELYQGYRLSMQSSNFLN